MAWILEGNPGNRIDADAFVDGPGFDRQVYHQELRKHVVGFFSVRPRATSELNPGAAEMDDLVAFIIIFSLAKGLIVGSVLLVRWARK